MYELVLVLVCSIHKCQRVCLFSMMCVKYESTIMYVCSYIIHELVCKSLEVSKSTDPQFSPTQAPTAPHLPIRNSQDGSRQCYQYGKCFAVGAPAWAGTWIRAGIQQSEGLIPLSGGHRLVPPGEWNSCYWLLLKGTSVTGISSAFV